MEIYFKEDLRADGMTMLNKTYVKWRLRIGQSASRTVVNGEMSLRRLKLSIYEVVTPREGEDYTRSDRSDTLSDGTPLNEWLARHRHPKHIGTCTLSAEFFLNSLSFCLFYFFFTCFFCLDCSGPFLCFYTPHTHSCSGEDSNPQSQRRQTYTLKCTATSIGSENLT
jgi:hypothetical protein